MPLPNQITAKQLSKLIGTPSCPTIIDVCIDDDFNANPAIIPGAKRCSHTNIQALAPALSLQKVVVTCHKGLKLSQGAAALLRNVGVAAESLEGGNVGWREANLPTVNVGNFPLWHHGDLTRWVTRIRPKVDRIASAWLIRRFLDKDAQFLFVGANEVIEVAEKFDAEPFDIENVRLTHRGPLCTFDTLLSELELKIPALDELATIIRAADTDNLDDNPYAPGLLAASLGLSRMHHDDNAQMEQGLGLYDMFYRWIRDARNETHRWPNPTKTSE